MSEALASGGRVWSPFSDSDNVVKKGVNPWIFLFGLALPFMTMMIVAFSVVCISLPYEIQKPESIAGGWTSQVIVGSSRTVLATSFVVGAILLIVGLVVLIHFCRVSYFFLIPLTAFGVPLITMLVWNVMLNVPSEVRAKTGSGPTFKEWAHDTYGYDLISSSIKSKDDREYVEAQSPQGEPVNINVFRDGENVYLYENTFQLNDTLTKINAEKQAKNEASK